MLKRYQVLLSDWLEDYINFVSERYDLSTSAVIRVHLALSILFLIPILYPKYKVNLARTELIELFKQAGKNELEEAEVHQMMSKILFEARKAVEYRLSKEK